VTFRKKLNFAVITESVNAICSRGRGQISITHMATASTLNDDVDAARAAMLLLDWQTAIDLLMTVKLLLATRPDTMFGGGAGMRFNAKDIDALVLQCQQRLREASSRAAAAAGDPFYVAIPVRYVGEGGCDV